MLAWMTREQPRRDMGAHTEGNVNTAGVNDAAGGSSTDGGVVGRLARASVVAEGAVGGRGGGVADAGNGALREAGGALGGHNGGEGSDSVDRLHFDGFGGVVVVGGRMNRY